VATLAAAPPRPPQALLEAPGEELQLEGAHGLWELAVCKDHHADVLPELVAATVKGLASPSVQVGGEAMRQQDGRCLVPAGRAGRAAAVPLT
jgi:hypothetical protein